MDVQKFEEIEKELGTTLTIGMLDWYAISSSYHALKEDFIRKYKGCVLWEEISKFQELSEDFIREFKHAVDWKNITEYQKLSEDFIREFKDKIWLEYLKINQNITSEIKNQFIIF